MSFVLNQDQKAFNTAPCIRVKDSREAVMTNHMSYTGSDILSTVLDNAAQIKLKEKQSMKSPMEKGKISGEGKYDENISKYYD